MKYFLPPVTRSPQTTSPPTPSAAPQNPHPPCRILKLWGRRFRLSTLPTLTGIEGQTGHAWPVFSGLFTIIPLFSVKQPGKAGQTCPVPGPRPAPTRTPLDTSPATPRSSTSPGPPNPPPHPRAPFPPDPPAPRRPPPDPTPAGSPPPEDTPRPAPAPCPASPRLPELRSPPSACRAPAPCPPSPP